MVFAVCVRHDDEGEALKAVATSRATAEHLARLLANHGDAVVIYAVMPNELASGAWPEVFVRSSRVLA